ncbi:MAG TPA: RNA methyltransferase [Bacteroidota bacterium]|nr:RNA methyltransferase [Bacteroidota bacterium]
MTQQIQRIDSMLVPELEPYRTLKRPLEHRKGGFFVAEGERVVRRLFESSLRIRSILLTDEWLKVYRNLIECRQEQINVFLAELRMMESIVGFQLHKGIMAIADIPPSVTLEQAVGSASKPYIFVAVDGVMNSENVGVIVRNCASFGVDALIVGETSCDPYLRRSVRNSMGNVFALPVVRPPRLADELAKVRTRFGARIVAAHPRATSVKVGEVDFSSDCCIVFGAEGDGVSAPVLDLCDVTTLIPMLKGVDSINVASASAVVLYEVQRQRGRARGKTAASTNRISLE